MPLASAITRHWPASPYWPKASDARLSPARTTRATPDSGDPEVGFCFGTEPPISWSSTEQVARVGEPSAANRV